MTQSADGHWVLRIEGDPASHYVSDGMVRSAVCSEKRWIAENEEAA
jgi:hypothetical protein